MSATIIPARKITFWTFNLDHPCTRISQQKPAVRGGHRLFKRNYKNAF
jgi:hypothetical protein